MFPWNIAKSAEAMFSRWAIKHVLKFLLKKKLGQFILGDLDLDQLEVQLGSGTIQLTNLALNVDFVNQKLGSLPVILKEGSIGSLLAKFPWRVSNCQIEVDELELVFVPCARKDTSAGAETSPSSGSCKQNVSTGSEKREHEVVNNSAAAISLDVHEGVKTIAKMVKWLLTSFHIKVKKLIVAYDPNSNEDTTSGSHRVLVLRINELEYGTSVCEENNARSSSLVDSLLGLSRLTNFIKFQGAIIELLQMDDVENKKNQTRPPDAPGATLSEWSMGRLPSETTTPILTGESVGFSGNIKVSLPWRNGSLDIHKVDADVSIDPINLRLQPRTITWFLCMWQSLKNVDTDGQCHMHDNNNHSVYFNSASQFHCSTLHSTVIATDQVLTSDEKLPSGFFSQTSRETPRDALLRGSHVIPDWVALSTNLNQNDRAEAEPDLSASIDQFFECFDGLRTSQSALGNSGILNWTCSVFSAITAASSLASGSLLMPSEQQPVETNFRASFSGVSVQIYLCDEDQIWSRDLTENNGQNAHYLGAGCQGLLLVLQICRRETKFEATVQHIELDEHFNHVNEAASSGPLSCDTIQNQSLLFQNLQAEVQGALPPFPLSHSLDSEATPIGSHSSISPIHLVSTNSSINNTSCGTSSKEDLVSVKLLKTSRVTPCQLTVTTAQLDGTKSSVTSFCVNLPPFIFWVNFNLLNKLLDLFKKIENSIEMNSNKDSGFEVHSERFKSPCPGDMKSSSSPQVSSSSSKGHLKGSISLPNARIILCFPLENHKEFKTYSLWHQFIGLDITQEPSKESSADACLRNASSQPTFSDKFCGSIYLHVENIKMYLIAGNGKDVQSKSTFQKNTYFAHEILSVTAGTKCFACIGMLWQDGRVTGPWVAMRARGLVTSQDSTGSTTRAIGKGSEFASVTTMGDQDNISSCTQEMIFSSTFLLHIRLPSVSVKFSSSQYQLLNLLFDQVMDDFSRLALNTSSTETKQFENQVASTSQTSVLFECNFVEVISNLDKLKDIKCSLQSELPGWWRTLKLQIQKLELLSVSNLGGISGTDFFWLGHGEGSLRGSIDGFPAQDLLLISCSDSTLRRGDGEGTNALSSGLSGSAIVFLMEPQILQSFTNVTIKGGTIIAPGGRLDWLNAICDFFSLPSDRELACHNSDHRGSSESKKIGASFILNLVDIALSYEPCESNSITGHNVFEPDCTNCTIDSEDCREHVASLLAASSLNLSSQTVACSTENDYNIRVQDLGLLISASSGPQIGNVYDIKYLHKAGYVKVAGEALVEAVLRTNCKNGLLWELECCDSQINLDTCHDTTSGLVRLAVQFQQLFAPDLQESMVHLQSRWKAVQQVNCSNDFIEKTKSFDGGSASSPYCVKSSGQDASASSRYTVVGIMDDICEDVFQFIGNVASRSDSCELQSSISLDTDHLGEAYCSSVSNTEYFSHNKLFGRPMPQAESENTDTSSAEENCCPKLIEGYYKSGLSPLKEVPSRNHSRSNLKRNSRNQEPAGVRGESSGWYKDSSPMIVENHIPKVRERPQEKEVPSKCEFSSNNCTVMDDLCKVRGRVVLKNIDVRWRLYAGSDWHSSTKSTLHKMTGGGRDTGACLELTLSAANLQYDMYPDGEVCASKLSVSVQDFNIYDNSTDAPWKLVLGYYHSKDHPRESSAKAFKLDLEAVRPNPSTPLEEYRLRLALLPVLLHLDQDQLDFLITFFGAKESLVDQPTGDAYGSRLSESNSSNLGGNIITEEALLPFFQKFDIWPVVVRVDYSPRRIDLAALRGGNYVHLVNLVPWKGIELGLKHVHAVGIYGWSSVFETIVGEWLEDISHNQMHKFLRGLPPVRSLFTVGSGAAKLVSLPVKNYKEDQRLLKGIQRGAIAFLRSISLEAVGLGVHLAAGVHDILLQTECRFTNIPPSICSPTRSKTKTNVRSNQPKDAQQGIQQAYESLSEGFGKSASALVGNPLKAYQRGGGAGSALAGALCAAPSAAIAPASAAVRAVHCALLGVRNSLDPEHKKESMEKYLGPNQPSDHN